jgi:hypothetical protein
MGAAWHTGAMTGEGRVIIGISALLVVLLFAQIAPADGSATGSGQRKYTIDTRGKNLYRPHTLYFGAHERIHSIRWRSWGGRRARGRGTYPVNDCIPACAFGTLTPYSVRLILKRVRSCNGKPTYLRLVFIFDRGRPMQRPRRDTVPQGFYC